MVARLLKNAALGGAVTLAVAAALATFWGIGSGRPVLAGNLAGAPAHYKDGLPRLQMSRADTGADEQAGSSIFLPLVSRNPEQPLPPGETTAVPDSAIPAVSVWGMAVLALALLVGAKIYYGRRRAAAA